MNCEVGGSERRGARLGCAEGWGGEGSSPGTTSFWPAQGQTLPERQLSKGRAATSSSREPKASVPLWSPLCFSPQNLVQRAGVKCRKRPLSLTTELNNRSGKGRLLPWSAQTQGESPPEPDSFFKIMLGLKFRVLPATSEVLELALAALSGGTITLLWDQEPVS